MNLSSFLSACDRIGLSDGAAAIIASSLLHDNAECSEANTSSVSDQSKSKKFLEEAAKNIIGFLRKKQRSR